MSDIKYIDLKDENSVQYNLYPELAMIASGGKMDLRLAAKLLTEISETVNQLSGNYMWHNDKFELSTKNVVSCIESDNDDLQTFSFNGFLNYGENVEDEWFLVYLLIQLTKLIKGLIVQIKDTDGEILLIEAAEHLPSWVTPESGEGRTFLYKGEVHILPLSFKTNNDGCTVTNDMLNYIRANSDKIKCNSSVQKAIQDRISEFPDNIQSNFHNAILYLPVGVASLINADGNLVAPAVRAFCGRDLIDVKACRAMKYFPPENRVYSQVKFTRLLYAMLATSKFTPDKRTGWNLPEPSDKNYKSHILGVKLACGFEILVSQERGSNKTEQPEDVDFANDPGWIRFLKRLTAMDYFRGLLEHSNQYNELLNNAKEYYRNSCDKVENKGREILKMLNKLDVDVSELKRREENLPKADDDSWMNVTREDLDSLLGERFGFFKEGNSSNQGDITGHLDDFLNHVSGIEGAEFPKNRKDTSGKGENVKKGKSVKFSPDTKCSSDTPVESNVNVSFEPEGFINAIQNILDFSIPDDNYWESEGSEMSSYEDETESDIGERPKATSSGKDSHLMEYMRTMDRELSGTTMGKSFVKEVPPDDENDSVEDFAPVDVNVNALKNILSSYRAQMGEPGPAENLLGPLGVNLDDLAADVD